MKHVVLVLAAISLTGCSTPIGPFSYMAHSHVRNRQVSRAYTQLPEAARPRVLEAFATGGDVGQATVGLQLNVTELLSTQKTTGEIALETVGSLADVALYAGILKAGVDLYEDSKDDDKPEPVADPRPEGVTVNLNSPVYGDVQVTVVTGAGSSSNGDSETVKE